MSYDTAKIRIMEIETAGSDSVRIPTPREGVATHVRRYSEDRAVIVHPADFARLEMLDNLLTELATPAPFVLSEAAEAAHLDSVTPGEPVTDPDELRRLFA